MFGEVLGSRPATLIVHDVCVEDVILEDDVLRLRPLSLDDVDQLLPATPLRFSCRWAWLAEGSWGGVTGTEPLLAGRHSWQLGENVEPHHPGDHQAQRAER